MMLYGLCDADSLYQRASGSDMPSDLDELCRCSVPDEEEPVDGSDPFLAVMPTQCQPGSLTQSASCDLLVLDLECTFVLEDACLAILRRAGSWVGMCDDVVLVNELAQGLSMNVNVSKLLLMMNPD